MQLCVNIKGGLYDPDWKLLLTELDFILKSSSSSILEICHGAIQIIPLHVICYKKPPIYIVSKMIEICPSSVKVRDRDGNLPLHYACEGGAEYDVIKFLLDMHPSSKLDEATMSGKVLFFDSFRKTQ